MKQIPRLPNYSVTKDGRVWSYRRKRWLAANSNGTGYQYVKLLGVNYYIHRLVLETYVGACPEGMECRHLNSNRADNRLKNLKWGTRSENHIDAVKQGTHSGLLNGENKSNSKLKESDVRMIVYMYKTGLFYQREIAKIYGVGRETIKDILTKRNWRHIWAT